MTVNELIVELQKFDGNTKVLINERFATEIIKINYFLEDGIVKPCFDGNQGVLIRG